MASLLKFLTLYQILSQDGKLSEVGHLFAPMGYTYIGTAYDWPTFLCKNFGSYIFFHYRNTLKKPLMTKS